jgi:PAB-dependent poly(A)-specific ribonuclease subunit 2
MYGRNTRGMRRNQVEDTHTTNRASNSLLPPKFLSEKARESAKSPPVAPIEQQSPEPQPIQAPEVVLIPAQELESLKADAPDMYKIFEIKYSKFGVDDFDFKWVSPRSLQETRRIKLLETIRKLTCVLQIL